MEILMEMVHPRRKGEYTEDEPGGRFTNVKV